jgi:hypothetical protein
VPRWGEAVVKKSEKAAKEALRNHPQVQATDHVIRVTKKGAGMEYNQGQSIKQGFGSGIRDALAARKKK